MHNFHCQSLVITVSNLIVMSFSKGVRVIPPDPPQQRSHQPHSNVHWASRWHTGSSPEWAGEEEGREPCQNENQYFDSFDCFSVKYMLLLHDVFIIITNSLIFEDKLYLEKGCLALLRYISAAFCASPHSPTQPSLLPIFLRHFFMGWPDQPFNLYWFLMYHYQK